MSTLPGNQRQNTHVHEDVDQLIDEYLTYEEAFNPIHTSRRARRKRKPRVDPAAHRVDPQQEAAQLADELDGRERGFVFTYQPARHEEGFLIESLRPFFTLNHINDVVAVVKGGKEANVYRCRAVDPDGATWLAAKVYRPRIFRTLRNDAQYRRGRQTLGANGQAVKKTDHRTIRALGKKSSFGVQVAHTSWLMYEYTTLQKLYTAGAAVPRPVAAAENAILMGYIGDATLPAPTLNEVQLDREEAGRLYAEVLRNIEVLLAHNLIHGDLSPYNILYWQGEITLIDFPQITYLRKEGGGVHDDARFLLERDVHRVCDYFQQQGVRTRPDELFQAYWTQYARESEELLLADWSRWEPEEQDG